MQKQKSQSPPANKAGAGGFGVQDVLFILFKHKWMILLLGALGIGGAAAVFMKREPIFQSQAKLLVRYVLQRDTVDSYQSQSTPGGARVDSVMSTEIEILTSVDLALDVAQGVGVDKLVPEAGGQATPSDAAGKILGNLIVAVGQSTNVLHLVYSDEDPEMSKVVLKELMDRYFEKHLQIHRSAAAFDMVSKQTEEVRQRLQKTERELNKLRTDSGILSLADATGALSTQRANTHEDLMKAKADYAEQEASLEAMERETGLAVQEASKSEPASTPGIPKATIVQPPAQALQEYRTVSEMLAFLQKRDFELRIKFKGGNPLITNNQEQMANYEAKQRALVAKYPNLAAQAEVVEKENGSPLSNLISEKARLAALAAKIQVYETNLKVIGEQFSEQYNIGARIEELDRRRQMEEEEYRSLEGKLKNAKIDDSLDPSRMPNITIVQHPTEPIKSYDALTNKIMLGLAGGGLALGLGLAFIIELLFDRKVKRPMDIQTRLQLPLLLSIPFIRRKERGGFLLGHESGQPRIGMGGEDVPGTALTESGKDVPAPFAGGSRKVGHFILPYSETIRDRIIFNFEINNLTHKPKLVAVTGLSEGAGASTVAAGLAKSFSEIPGMKVLLVDLSSFHPEDNPLFGEIPRHTLNGALHLARNNQFRDNPQALYYASANARRDDSGITTFSPVHLYELMPHLQASQYDYIIFDMPPVDQTSRTLTMAGLMDKVLLVLDAENTSRDGLMWGYSELVKGRADVSCIFNKTRSHVPGWLIGGEV